MRTSAWLPALLLFSAAIAACDERKSGWTDIGIDELETLIREKKATVIDNNPKFVFEKRRLPGATWLNAVKYEASDLPADKGAAVVFYCMNEG
ncbi:MAG: hypothetical protein HYY18_14830 [Planctomycetes bacterium]|nr:hypothetical protein [Planctomycetota bacterium]